MVERSHLDTLVSQGLLHNEDLRLPGPKVVSSPSAGYVVSFVHFHEQGFDMLPLHPLLVGVLHYYKVQLHHLNPNGIQYMVAFVALCEGYLGIGLNFHL